MSLKALTLGASGSSSAWTEQTGAYTMKAADMIAANTKNGSFTLKLPATAIPGDSCQVLDELGTWGINPISIDPNGGKIAGMTQIQKFWRSGAKLVFSYQGATNGWMMDGGADLAPVFDEGNAVNQMHPGLTTFANGRGFRSVYDNATLRCGKASAGKSSGKLYFEFKYTQIAGGNWPCAGLAVAATALTSYPGNGSTDYGVLPGSAGGHASLVQNGANVASSTTGNYLGVGDVMGFAVDMGGGVITIYRNNVQLMQATGLSLAAAPYYLGAGSNGAAGAAAGIFSTRAAHCAYTPPNGYSYWDN
jgi:hypothetical protein